MPLPQIRPEAVPTEFAKLYGEDTAGWFRGTKKSGVTPLNPLPPGGGRALHPYLWHQRKLIEAAQRKTFFGFSARELKSMRAFTYFESPLPSSLPDLHHPVLTNWESATDPLRRHTPVLPMGKGRPGYWEMSNPLIFPVMVPVIRLATQMINVLDFCSWWDTVAFGELKRIDESLTGPVGVDYYKVLPRDPHMVEQARERTRKQFADLALVIQWGITDPKIDPRSSLSGGATWLGLTVTDWVNYAPRCFIDIGRVEVLMRTDLPAAERFLIETSLATTMLHELGHAWWRFRSPLIYQEPYYGNELTCELGYSLINALFKGRDAYIKAPGSHSKASSFSYGDTERHIAFIQTPYPSMYDLGHSSPSLGIVDTMRYGDYFPIPVEYFERIQQRDFWEYHVRIYGAESLHLGPLVYGRRLNEFGLVDAPDADEKDVIYIGNLLGESVPAARIENKKRLTASAVQRALMETIETERSQDEQQLDTMLAKNPMSHVLQGLRASFTLDHIRWVDELEMFVPEAVDETEMIREPERFVEIADFLIRNQLILAIATMEKPIPESAFLEHINRLGESLGEIHLTREGFREFLIYVEYQGILLLWDPSGLGEVSMRPHGWGIALPESNEEPENVPEKPPAKHLEIVEEYFYKLRGIHTIHRMMDIDEDLLLLLLNQPSEAELSKADYDKLMAYLDYQKKYFIRGPPGIARCILTKDEEKDIFSRFDGIEKKRQEEEENTAAAVKARYYKLKRRREQMEEEDKELTSNWKKKRESIMQKLGPSYISASKQDDKSPEPKKRKIDSSPADVEVKERAELGLPPIDGLAIVHPNDDSDDSEEEGGVLLSTEEKKGSE